MQAIYDWARNLYEETGINLVFIYEEYERVRFIEGFQNTVWLGVICVILSVVIGVIGAWLQGSKFRIIRLVVAGYIQFFRNTPPLVQLLFFYFALGKTLENIGLMPMYDAGGWQQPLIGNFGWAVVSLSFFAGSFNVEIFRSGIEAVPTSTREAAEALGYTRLKAYIYIVLPLAFRVCLPSLNNNLVNLVKTTTLAYVIAVPEMMYTANQIWSDNVNVPEMMVTLFIVYVSLVGVLVWMMHKWERALRVPGFGQGA
ncbi:MAG: amino acid ABC transporter permease [Gammaproteobacteria bacterium]|nr:amino acid ABC transporter permease [Gammaproteobacteria bacterium]